MKFKRSQLALCKHFGRCFVAVLCSLTLLPGEAIWAVVPQDKAAPETAAKLSADQLDALVAPIALYPDSLLSQALVASTYPLELIQLQQWLEKNKDLKGKALTDAAMKQNWDPSIQAMALLPDMVKQLAGNIKWTTDLGNAVLAQQGEVMDAVQRMRGKADEKGNLKTTEQMKVEKTVVENKQVIVIENANPEVVYVPSYNPVVVYGPPVYAYPPIVYPPVGYYAAGMALSFGVGMMVGAAWGGGGWGCGWGGGGNNNININRNNTFVNNSNRQNFQGGNRVNPLGGGGAAGGGNWQHNPQHRGGAPYGDRGTANKYGGTARGDSPRASNNRSGSPSAGNMDRGSGNRSGSPSAGNMDRGGGNRGGSPSAGNMDRGGGDRGGSPSAGSMDRGGGGNRSAGSGGGGGAFGGGSGSSARASSSRGSSSYGGGGGRSGGGGRGGGGGRR